MSRTRSALGYLLFGLGAGAAGMLTGILLAPASGRETRRRWSRRLEEETDALKRKGRQILDHLSEHAPVPRREEEKRVHH